MKFVPAFVVLGLSAGVSHAATPAPQHQSAPKETSVYCPVSGDKIASPKDAYSSQVYKGKTYYFCCPDCKPQFDKNPEKYVKHPAARKS